MIVSGAPVPSEKLQGTALFDAIVEGDLLEGALAFARQCRRGKAPLKRVRDIRITLPDAEAFFQFARNSVGALAKNFPAPLKCVDAVAAAVSMPFDEGLRYERELFTQLVLTPESRALRHAFFAERAATKVPGIGVRYRAAQGRTRRRHRRRYDGRRHRDEFPERRRAGDDPGDEAGGAGQGACDHPPELRRLAEKGQADARKAGADDGAARVDAVVRRHRAGRPGDRGGVRGHCSQAGGVRATRRVHEARRDHRDQYVDARRRSHRRLHPPSSGCRRPAFFQPGERDEAARSRARREDRARRDGSR